MLNNESNQEATGTSSANGLISGRDVLLEEPLSLKKAFTSMANALDVEAITTDWLRHVLVSSPATKERTIALLERAIVDIDDLLSRQIDEILHTEPFQQIEASWRSLHYLVDTEAEYDEELTIKIKILDISWAELANDVSRAIEFDQSQTFHRIYSDEFDMPGGEPFGVMLGDYHISHRPRKDVFESDTDVLNDMAKIATAALCPFITNANNTLFGIDSYRELGQHQSLQELFDQQAYIKWRSLRQQEDMRFVGLTLPNILMREPYRDDGTRSEGFIYQEKANDSDEDYLWGSACYAFGGVLIRAFANTGWFADIRGGVHGYGEGGAVRNLSYARYDMDKKGIAARPSTNVQVHDFLERELSETGFIPLCSFHSAEHSVFYSNNSLHEPPQYESEIATLNAKLSSMIQYMLCVSRFGHFIKVMIRDKIGSFSTAADCQRFLQDWLNEYTTSSDGTSSELKARYPLAACKVEVHEQAGRLGHYTCVAHLQPHFQLDQLVSSIRLVTELAVGTTTGSNSA